MCSPVAVDRPVPLDVLEREITQLASEIHAATCRWLGLVAEFDRREGWGPWGCKSCAHWVSWRCGIAPVAAREHVRVARRMEELPQIRRAFAEGRLSYSKVRALTRVEGIVREAELLELARHATASQLERLVRAYRGVVAVERAAEGGGPDRWLTWSHDEDGSMLLRGRLPAEEGALLVAALEAASAEHARRSPDGASARWRALPRKRTRPSSGGARARWWALPRKRSRPWLGRAIAMWRALPRKRIRPSPDGARARWWALPRKRSRPWLGRAMAMWRALPRKRPGPSPDGAGAR